MAPTPSTPEFGRLIRDARVKAGMSQSRLASEVSRTATTVRRWEHGESAPTAETLPELATALQLPVAELEEALRAEQRRAEQLQMPSDSEASGDETGGRDPAPAPAPQPRPQPKTVVVAAPSSASTSSTVNATVVSGDSVTEANPIRPAASVSPAAAVKAAPAASPPSEAAPPAGTGAGSPVEQAGAAVVAGATSDDPSPEDRRDPLFGAAAVAAIAAAAAADGEPGLQTTDPNAVAEVPVVRAAAAPAQSAAEATTDTAPDSPPAEGDSAPQPWFDLPTEPVAIPAPPPEPTDADADLPVSLSARAVVDPEQSAAQQQVLVMAPSYLESRKQRAVYGVRLILTVILLGAGALVLVWASGELIQALGDVIDLFQEPPEPTVPTSTPLSGITG